MQSISEKNTQEKQFIVSAMSHSEDVLKQGAPLRNRDSNEGIFKNIYSSMNLDANALLSMLLDNECSLDVNQELLNRVVQKFSNELHTTEFDNAFAVDDVMEIATNEGSPKKRARIETLDDVLESPLKKQKTLENVVVELQAKEVTRTAPKPKPIPRNPTITQQIKASVRKDITKSKVKITDNDRIPVTVMKNKSKFTVKEGNNNEFKVKYSGKFNFFLPTYKNAVETPIVNAGHSQP